MFPTLTSVSRGTQASTSDSDTRGALSSTYGSDSHLGVSSRFPSWGADPQYGPPWGGDGRMHRHPWSVGPRTCHVCASINKHVHARSPTWGWWGGTQGMVDWRAGTKRKRSRTNRTRTEPSDGHNFDMQATSVSFVLRYAGRADASSSLPLQTAAQPRATARPAIRKASCHQQRTAHADRC